MRAEKLKGKLTVGLVRSNTDGDFMSVEVTDELSGCKVLTAEMSIEDFSRALFGHAFKDCMFSLSTKYAGMKREVKDVNIECEWMGSKDVAKAKKLIAKHEVDGWEGRFDDMFNHHNRTATGYNVTFIRFVKP